MFYKKFKLMMFHKKIFNMNNLKRIILFKNLIFLKITNKKYSNLIKKKLQIKRMILMLKTK